jgi:dihydrofolate reductase
MNIIAAVDANWAIGYGNKLLVHIPSDMKFFRETTIGKVIVMGRKTLESFPNGLPLTQRTNIVLTTDPNYKVKGATMVSGIEDLMEELKKYPTEDIYVVGGERVYRQLLPYCDVAYITKIDHRFQADTYFPNLDEMSEWELVEEGEEHTCFNLEYCFTRYERKRMMD